MEVIVCVCVCVCATKGGEVGIRRGGERGQENTYKSCSLSAHAGGETQWVNTCFTFSIVSFLFCC